MALIFPTVENIKRLKKEPEKGEWFLLKYLLDTLDDSFEIYFQPFLNGLRPDIIIMKKNHGVVIVEVKDWNLKNWSVLKDNSWHFTDKSGVSHLKTSPMMQVFNYKKNLFTMQINGMLEKVSQNPAFYKIITPFVYFHNQSKEKINNLYINPLEMASIEMEELNAKFKNDRLNNPTNNEFIFQDYEKKRKYLHDKLKQLRRDQNVLSVTQESLKKITHSNYFVNPNIIFKTPIYDEFKRHLQPPYHELNEGIEINYEKKQKEFSESKNELTKIKGVAGSGKTVVLAKRAVNAHKRHEDTILILTYNLTLKSYIHDRISDVREGFSWEYFYINNYHQHILQVLNQHNISWTNGKMTEEEMNRVFSDINLFKSVKDELEKFKTILIDEAQDYEPEWIKIIRDNFLEEGGEMVLFGDAKQNIYHQELDSDKNYRTPNGFGNWKMLNKTIRHKQNSHILKLAKEFQKAFLSKDYDIDKYEENQIQQEMAGLGINKVSIYKENSIEDMVKIIYTNIKNQNLHPNDVAIICSRIKVIQEFDFIIRNAEGNENRTMTTFEPKEFKVSQHVDLKNMRRSKKVAFNLNPGTIKLATTYSFKGFESPTVFLILDEKDNNEIVYTAITRAKFNIMIFLKNDSKYKSFFQSHLEVE